MPKTRYGALLARAEALRPGETLTVLQEGAAGGGLDLTLVNNERGGFSVILTVGEETGEGVDTAGILLDRVDAVLLQRIMSVLMGRAEP